MATDPAEQIAADKALAQRLQAKEDRAPMGGRPKARPDGAVDAAQVARAAEAVATERAGRGAPAARPPPAVAGPLPPPASSTGRMYYLLEPRHGFAEPTIAAGQSVTLGALGGHWNSKGLAPTGYGSLEDAVNAASAKWPDRREVRVRWA